MQPTSIARPPRASGSACRDRCGGRGIATSTPGPAGDVELVALCYPDGAHFALLPQSRSAGKVPQLHEDILSSSTQSIAPSPSPPDHCTPWDDWGSAGNHVYVEKPVSHNIIEGRRMVDFARHHKKIVQTGTQRRSDAQVERAMKFIHDGGIGQLQVARALCYKRRKSIGDVAGPQPVPPSVHYGLWLGPAPEKPVMREQFHYDWHWQWDYGNGALGNQASPDGRLLWVFNKTPPPLRAEHGGRYGTSRRETPNTQVSCSILPASQGHFGAASRRQGAKQVRTSSTARRYVVVGDVLQPPPPGQA